MRTSLKWLTNYKLGWVSVWTKANVLSLNLNVEKTFAAMFSMKLHVDTYDLLSLDGDAVWFVKVESSWGYCLTP